MIYYISTLLYIIDSFQTCVIFCCCGGLGIDNNEPAKFKAHKFALILCDCNEGMYNSPLYFLCRIMALMTIRRLLMLFFSGLIICNLFTFKMVSRSSFIGVQQNGSILDKQYLQDTMKYPPFSKDVIVHTAYFDQRPRKNHANVTVIFLTINRTIMDSGLVIGCGVDGKDASAFSLYSLFENTLLHDWLGDKPFIYENMEVLCYDMPGKNGSEVFVVYKTAAGLAQNQNSISISSLHPCS